jgi:hypothetical protein
LGALVCVAPGCLVLDGLAPCAKPGTVACKIANSNVHTAKPLIAMAQM